MDSAEQIELQLPPRSTNSILEDKIAVLAARLTHELDPFKRVELSVEAERLKRLIGRPE